MQGHIRLLTLLFVFMLSAPLMGQEASAEKEGPEKEEKIIPGRLMAQMKKGVDPGQLAEELAKLNGSKTDLKVKRKVSDYMNIWLFSYDPDNVDKYALLRKVREHRGTELAQFEHRLERRLTPNDPMFTSPDKWPYVNDGSNGGVVDADTDADLAWDITTGGTTSTGDTIVVAVIDGGVQVDHEDLNIFKNEPEVNGTAGVDDDGNGYVDDVNGWDAYNSDGTIPSDGHGTHVSGTVGGIGDNNTGFVGVNWDVQVLPIAGSSTNESTVVSAYDYAVKMRDLYDSTNGNKGAFVVATNSSFGVDGGDPSNFPVWCAMYDTLGNYGITNAVAGPNNDVNIDSVGDVPGACPSPHTICLTNTQNDDSRANAGYGEINVDLGAPGTDILSTYPTNSYNNLSGTSMATPHVAGTIGLLYSVDCPELMTLTDNDPDSASLLIKEAIMEGVDTISSMQDTITRSKGRLNIHKALLELGNLGVCDTNTGCYTPYGLSADSITDSSAVLYYNGPSTADSIKVQYKKSSAASWDSAWTSSTDSFAIDKGLLGCTDYEFRVKAYCPTDTSNYSGIQTFQTKGCCNAPSGLVELASGSQMIQVEWNGVYGASSYELHFKSVDSASWNQVTVLAGTDTTVKGLIACHEYDFRVRADCDTGYSPYSSVMTFSTTCDPCDSNAYCGAQGNDTQYEWLDKVDIQSLSDSTGDNSGYLFSKGPNAVLHEDSSYVISLSPGFDNGTYSEYFRIWIDLNRNGSFDTPDEELFAKDAVTSTVTDTLTIPDSIAQGGSRMRIAMKFDAAPGPCESFDFGEVEDYCVRLETSTDSTGQALAERSEEDAASLYPNPASERVELRMERMPKEGSYFVLHDAMGSRVMEQSVEESRETFDISDLSEGTYFYSVVNDGVIARGKLIIGGR